MRKLWLSAVVAGLLAVGAGSASAIPATTLYDNSSGGTALYLSSGFFSDTANDSYTFYSPFTLTSASSITGITWWGFYQNTDTGAAGMLPTDGGQYSFDIQGNDGTPSDNPTGELIPPENGTLTIGTPTAFAAQPDGGEVYEFNATVDIPLPAGSYYLSIYNTESTASDPIAFAWSDSSIGGETGYQYYFPEPSFYSNGNVSAFILTGGPAVEPTAIPEPATMTLLGLGLAGLIGRQIRRRK